MALQKDYSLDHHWLVGTFFISYVVLVAADIITDILQAVNHFQNGHTRWGLATIGFIWVSCLDLKDHINFFQYSIFFYNQKTCHHQNPRKYLIASKNIFKADLMISQMPKAGANFPPPDLFLIFKKHLE